MTLTWFSDLISGRTTTFADAISVDGCSAAADSRSDQSALFATGYSTDHSAGASTSSCRQFVTMFLPKAAAVFVAVPNTTAMSMGDVVVAVPVAAALRRRWNS